MSFNFDEIDLGSDAPTDSLSIRSFDHIKDATHEGAEAPDWKVAQAYAEEIKTRMAGYKSTKAMLNRWFASTSALQFIADHDPLIYLDIVHHFADELERCTSESVTNSH